MMVFLVVDKMHFEEITSSLCVSEIQFRRFKCLSAFFVRVVMIMSNSSILYEFSRQKSIILECTFFERTLYEHTLC